MTESAKQDPVAATADAAEPESAATAGDGDEASPDTAKPAAAPDSGAVPGEGAKPDLDEVKRKFREALDRKHGAHAEGQAKGGRDAGKGIHGSHGPAASRRSFRRKSG